MANIESKKTYWLVSEEYKSQAALGISMMGIGVGVLFWTFIYARPVDNILSAIGALTCLAFGVCMLVGGSDLQDKKVQKKIRVKFVGTAITQIKED